MTDKPPFDPNAAFSASPPEQGGPPPLVSKPAFDPSAPFTTAAPSNPDALPDVGPPAISYGQEEFSPGLPAVNQYADVLARSANKNLIEPVTHPIDTALGLGRLAAGAAQYAGLPGDEFKPYAKALADDYAKTYGSLEGFGTALKEDPVRVAMDASLGVGALGKLGRAGRAAHVAAPTADALFDAAEGHYNAMHGFGVELHPQVMADTADNIVTELKTQGYRDYLAPKTFRAVEELRNPDGKFMTTQEVEGVRRALNKAAGDPAERDAARRAIGEIDDTMANLSPADAAINPHFAPRVAEEALAARGNYAAGKRAEAIEGATDRASLQAASTGSGANIDNATRQQIKNLLNNPKRVRGFSAEERAQMRDIVTGTFTGNAARLLGKLAPSGIVSGTLSAGLGHAVGHTMGVPAVGFIAKQIGDAATRRAAAKLSEQVRLRSPLARQIGSGPRPLSGMPAGIRPALQTGRISNPFGQ